MKPRSSETRTNRWKKQNFVGEKSFISVRSAERSQFPTVFEELSQNETTETFLGRLPLSEAKIAPSQFPS